MNKKTAEIFFKEKHKKENSRILLYFLTDQLSTLGLLDEVCIKQHIDDVV